MKKILLTITGMIFTVLLIAQVPNEFKYQAVLRDASGDVMANESVTVDIALLQGNSSGSEVFTETHNVTTTAQGLINLNIGSVEDLNVVDWAADIYFVEITVDGTLMGASQLLSVPYALYAKNVTGGAWITSSSNVYLSSSIENVGIGTSNPSSHLVVKADSDDAPEDVLFEVKDNAGIPVFRVTSEGVRIYVKPNGKGMSGGFAVGQYGTLKDKAIGDNFLIVTADSTRIYTLPPSKGVMGGFAVGQYGTLKGGSTSPTFYTTPDSTRIYTKSLGKGISGGFAVGQYGTLKGSENNYLKLNENNYFIGHQSGDSITTGLYNTFFGYLSGKNTTEGFNNTFIGLESGFNNKTGFNNVFLGHGSGYSSTIGFQNVFIGQGAGYNQTTGNYNVFIGHSAGHEAGSGDLNVYIGSESGSKAISGSNVFVGGTSGLSVTTGGYNTLIGASAGFSDSTGMYNTILGAEAGRAGNGSSNVFLGAWAGDQSEGHANIYVGESSGGANVNGSNNVSVGVGSANGDGSHNVYLGYQSASSTLGNNNVFIGAFSGQNDTINNALYIENSSSSNPLIYGEFNNDKVVVNGSFNYGSASGTNSYTVTIPSVSAYTEGMAFYIKFANANTSECIIEVNGIGSKSIVNSDGSPLLGGELHTGGIHLIIYDGTNFQLITL